SYATGVARWDGSTWSALGDTNDPFNSVLAIAITTGGDIYVGGLLQRIGGVTVAGVAKWNGSTWATFDFHNGVGYDVYALGASDTDVYSGGFFRPYNYPSLNAMAK